MDTTGEDDEDIKLQRSSSHYIAELKLSLPRFLHKSKVPKDGALSTPRVRSLILNSKTDQLIKLLEPFQEWPQLLDPHLAIFLPLLTNAFIEYLSLHTADYAQHAGSFMGSNIIPLPRGICRILYTFCKVRGQKVVVQFLNNEPRHLEGILDALETWSRSKRPGKDLDHPDLGMIWEERFIMLLWLSHLMLTPFDLASISSTGAGTGAHTVVPAIVTRLVLVTGQYLDSAGKEREAAALLKSRLALRTDMQQIGIQQSLIGRALTVLGKEDDESGPLRRYSLIGELSFLAKYVVSAESEIIKPLLRPIHASIQQANSSQMPLHKEVKSSVMARKLVIKISRALAVKGIMIDRGSPNAEPSLGDGALEDIIDHMFTAISDSDTSVRVATSKALSVIAACLECEERAEIIETILQILQGDVVDGFDHICHPGLRRRQEINRDRANASAWHGLVLTLSQLAFRGAIPTTSLDDLLSRTLDVFCLAIRFEQRTSLGVPIGANVRDAACFGFWSLARNYTTAALMFEGGHTQIAEALISAATLDPAGNVRRGASAALQETIGRHPDELTHGIQLVQVVNYHAVALRSQAMLGVATNASSLDNAYWRAILNGLLDWRGIGSVDAHSRRLAGNSIALLAINNVPKSNFVVRKALVRKLSKISFNRTEERHGLVAALACVILREGLHFKENVTRDPNPYDDQGKAVTELLRTTTSLWTSWFTESPEVEHDNASVETQLDLVLRSAFVCEATCALIASVAASTKIYLDYSSDDVANSALLRQRNAPSKKMKICVSALELSLGKSNPQLDKMREQAVEFLFDYLHAEVREKLILKWAQQLRPESQARGVLKEGMTAALAAVFETFKDVSYSPPSDPASDAWPHHPGVSDKTGSMLPLQAMIIDSLLGLINHPRTTIELKCVALKSLTAHVLDSGVITTDLSNALSVCLDDYTVDVRGDVGSLVRVEAIDAVGKALSQKILNLPSRQVFAAKVCGLAVEKLDKIRLRAWNCLQDNLDAFGLGPPPSTNVADFADTSTEAYFRQLISFCNEGWVRRPLLEGYLTSAGAGSESVLQASRAAFVDYANGCSSSALTTYCSTFLEIIHDNLANDRLLVPVMDFLGFLFDAGVLLRLADETFSWTQLFNLIQRSHYKTSNIRKIEAAVRVYAGMAAIPRIQNMALKKLCQMSTHGYTKIRLVAADALFILTQDEQMLEVNWLQPLTELKDVVARASGCWGSSEVEKCLRGQ